MLIIAWSFFMPFFISAVTAVLVAKYLFADRHVIKALMKAKEAIMTEKEREYARESKSVRFIAALINKMDRAVSVKPPILDNINSMLKMMGEKKQAERELTLYIFKGLLGALPLIIVAVLTRVEGYLALYPLGVFLLTYRQYLDLKKKFRNWQIELVKDLPQLIDKLRISFAGGRDYMSAIIQANESSGPRMKVIVEQLVNDLQYMRYNQAFDHFSNSLKIPAATKFAAAMKISVEYGYEQAENYFRIIETDITEVRRTAIEELTKSKPEKVYQLYLLIMALAAAALAVKGWEIFTIVNKIM